LRRFVLRGLALVLLVGLPGTPATTNVAADSSTRDEETSLPIEIDKVETAKVRLIVIDAVVVDSAGRTVPNLTLEDFDVVTGGEAVAADTLDVDCQAALDEPRAIRHGKQREGLPPSKQGRKIVLAFDYLHLSRPQRVEVLDYAMQAVKNSGAAGDEILLAALNGGLRIEQPFTYDHDELWSSLRRMQRDITLWQPSFMHLNEMSWIRGVTTLFDVLGTVPGPKAVVFFSGMTDVPLDLQFQEIAAQAAASRCSVYPVDVRGLVTPENARALRAGGGRGPTPSAPG
jgi:VWFA-related protein